MNQYDIRFIQHNYQTSGQVLEQKEGKKIYQQMKRDTFFYFLKELKSFKTSIPIPCLSNKCVVPEKSKQEWSLFTGAGGYLLLYVKMYEFFLSLTEEQKEEYMNFAKDQLMPDEDIMQLFDPTYHLNNAYTQFVALETLCLQQQDKYISYYFSQATIWLYGSIIAYYKSDFDRYRVYVKKILDYYIVIINSLQHQFYELLYGIPGYIYILLQLQKKFGTEQAGNYKIEVKAYILELCKFIIKEGYRNFKSKENLMNAIKLPNDFHLTYLFYNTEYLGGAHGLFGNLQILLTCYREHSNFFKEADPQFTQMFLRSIEQTLKYIQSLQLPSGNFPCSGDSQDQNDDLIQFCHGAPGAIAPLLLASKIFKDQTYVKMAVKAADSVWKFGLIKKGSGLCHGIPGNSYCFLQLYKELKEFKYFEQSYRFITYRNDQQVVNQLKNYKFFDRLKVGESDHPFSLMLGSAGDLISQLDLIQGGGEGFPGFEI